MKIFTIGVYGYTAEKFFSDLNQSGVEVFYDIRWRRGVRGVGYSFANYRRLKDKLESLGIRYIHRKDFAPPPEIRNFMRLHVNNPFYLPTITEKTGEKASDNVFAE